MSNTNTAILYMNVDVEASSKSETRYSSLTQRTQEIARQIRCHRSIYREDRIFASLIVDFDATQS